MTYKGRPEQNPKTTQAPIFKEKICAKSEGLEDFCVSAIIIKQASKANL